MKQNIKMFCILAAAVLLLPGGVLAQELTRRMDYQKTNFTLAREWKSYKKWVIYNDRGDEFSFATMDTSGFNRILIKTQQHFHVKDMLMSSDTLFFCGSMLDTATMSQRGVLGYFTVPAMPSPIVHYIKIDDMATLNKIESYVNYSTKHVVMVGTGTDDVDYIVDAYRNFGSGTINPGSWQLSKTLITGVDAKFDDIAVIADDVVVSARVLGALNIYSTYLCFIAKTPMVNVPFYMSSTIQMKKLLGSASDKVLLQSGANDTLFAIYSRGTWLSVCQFKRYFNIASRQISTPLVFLNHFTFVSGKLMDVCVDKQNKNLNILFSVPQTVFDSTQRIYHVPIVQMTTGGVINYHNYSNGYHPMSLCRSLTNTTVSVGENSVSKAGLLWAVSRIHNNTAGNCTSLSTVTFDAMTLQQDDPVPKTHTDQWMGRQMGTTPVTTLSAQLTTVCE